MVGYDKAGVDGDRIHLLAAGGGTSSNNNNNYSKAAKKYAMERAMMEQTLQAAKQSDLILLMWDAKVGVTQDLAATARWLRKLGKTGISTDSTNRKKNEQGSDDDISFVWVTPTSGNCSGRTEFREDRKEKQRAQ